MKAAKAYLAVLGTTGLLTATVVVLLVVGSGVAAFEGPPDAGGTTSPLERIVVDEDAEAAADGARTRRAAGREAHRTAPRPPAGRQRSGSGQGVVRLGPRGVREGLGGRVPGGDTQDGGPGVGAPGGGPAVGSPAGGGPSGGGPAAGGSGDGASGGRGGGSLVPPPVGDPVGGVVEGATGVVGGTTAALKAAPVGGSTRLRPYASLLC